MNTNRLQNEQITRANYREYPALNASRLKSILSGGSVAHADVERTERRSTTVSPMRFGTMVHELILEDADMDYVVKDWSATTKSGKEKQSKVEMSGLDILTSEQDQAIRAIKSGMVEHPEIQELVESGMVEQPLLFDYRGRLCKSQIDLYSNKTLIDVKTTNNIVSFSKTFIDYHYDLQMAMYSIALLANGYELDKAQILVIETQAPFTIQLLDIPDVLMLGGERKIGLALDMLEKAEQTKSTKLPFRGTLDAPGWYLAKFVMDNDGEF